ncbi:11804_t:CDS:2, partial [Acaulospora morrowiae]
LSEQAMESYMGSNQSGHKDNIKKIKTKQANVKETNKTDKRTAQTITSLNKATAIAKKYLSGKIDAESMARQPGTLVPRDTQPEDKHGKSIQTASSA